MTRLLLLMLICLPMYGQRLPFYVVGTTPAADITLLDSVGNINTNGTTSVSSFTVTSGASIAVLFAGGQISVADTVTRAVLDGQLFTKLTYGTMPLFVLSSPNAGAAKVCSVYYSGTQSHGHLLMTFSNVSSYGAGVRWPVTNWQDQNSGPSIIQVTPASASGDYVLGFWNIDNPAVTVASQTGTRLCSTTAGSQLLYASKQTGSATETAMTWTMNTGNYNVIAGGVALKK
jgi:hypothetical protein